MGHVTGYIVRLGMRAEPEILLPALHIDGEHTVEALSALLVAAHLGPRVLFGPAVVAGVLLTDAELIIEEDALLIL